MGEGSYEAVDGKDTPVYLLTDLRHGGGVIKGKEGFELLAGEADGLCVLGRVVGKALHPFGAGIDEVAGGEEEPAGAAGGEAVVERGGEAGEGAAIGHVIRDAPEAQIGVSVERAADEHDVGHGGAERVGNTSGEGNAIHQSMSFVGSKTAAATAGEDVKG